MPPADGRLAGRLGARRTVERLRDAAVRDRDMVDPRLPGDESPEASLPDIAMADGLVAVDRAVVRDRDVVRGLEVVGLEVVDLVVDLRTVAATIGFADCMVLAAVISALAAVVIALVAVFIDCIADDIVRADAVAFVAAAVILVAADVTLVAAVETPLAAVAGVVLLRLPVVVRLVVVPRVVPLRLVVLRPPEAVLRRVVLARDAVGREAVDRDAVLRVDRDVVLLVVDRDAVLRAGLAAVLRLADRLAEDALEPDMDDDRLAVPRDALRLAGLLRAELAELRRGAARVVD
ncbi:MAG TPA: hypothetical protein VH520_13915 [Streptosporangiaceae bacterium]